MTKKQKVKKIIAVLHEKFGNPECALKYETPFELLVAVSLSAQCTDKRVNIVTEEMFRKKGINTPKQFAEMELEEIEVLVKSTGFYKNKAKNIKKTSEMLLEKYNGEVPQEMDKLVALAGVGRKTANVVRGEVWRLAEGVTVDTHVKRLTNLIGLIKGDNPIIIERELMELVPKEYWIDISHYLILQGRDVCVARRPQCSRCEINIFCNFGRKKLKKEEKNNS